MVHITNKETDEAAEMFKQLEGTDIHPAAAVATASLIKAVKAGQISPRAIIMLNITGGGEERFKRERFLYYLQPSLVLEPQTGLAELEKQLDTLF
jgi:cysteate synthase